MRKIIIAGNWKMNKTNSEAVAYLKELKEMAKDEQGVDIVIGAPYTALADAVRTVEGSNIAIAAQNVYPKDSGAYTGEISPVMLKEIGVKYVILGHSERRQYFGETDAFINEKVKACIKHGLVPILCIGETLEEREHGKVGLVCELQLKGGLAGVTAEEAKNVVIAYEPIWAIGTGKTATPEIAEETHKIVRDILAEMFGEAAANHMTIQYGGSMNAKNAAELMEQPDIDGGLVGGASLEAATFIQVIKR